MTRTRYFFWWGGRWLGISRRTLSYSGDYLVVTRMWFLRWEHTWYREV